MMISRWQLKFHETFQAEMGYIAKILKLASQDFIGTKFEISDETGIPTGKQKGKVEPTIKYAAFMGLIAYTVEKGVYQLGLTQLGQEVYDQDCYLHETLTHWLCHCNIVNETKGAPQWAFITSQLEHHYNDTISMELACKQANKYFQLDVTGEELFGVVRRSYTEGCFSGLNVVDWAENLKFTQHTESPELTYVYAYGLFLQWENLIPEQGEITMETLQDTLHFGAMFGFDEEEVSEVLETLARLKLLSVNRQLFPATIARHATAEAIIPHLYDNLI